MGHPSFGLWKSFPARKDDVDKRSPQNHKKLIQGFGPAMGKGKNRKFSTFWLNPKKTRLILRILKIDISLEFMPLCVFENDFSSFQAVC